MVNPKSSIREPGTKSQANRLSQHALTVTIHDLRFTIHDSRLNNLASLSRRFLHFQFLQLLSDTAIRHVHPINFGEKVPSALHISHLLIGDAKLCLLYTSDAAD